VTPLTRNNIIAAIFTRGVLFLFAWWFLADGDNRSWWIGAPAVLLATTISITLIPPIFIAWYEVLKFLPFFLLRSLLGGADVARRAFEPSMQITPDFIIYPLRLAPGLPQVLMANIVNLLPGTLTADINQNALKIHVLDSTQEFLNELDAVQHSVSRIFGTPLQAAYGGKWNEKI
jgi:multicomponent Na+:H+ antiporter subunit E